MRTNFFARIVGPSLLIIAVMTACGNESVTGPDPSAEEERLIRQIEGSGFPECIAEFQRVFPTLQNLTPQQRLAELARILRLCFTPSTPPPPPPGDLEVNTSTTGEDLDPDGYTVAVPGQTSQAIGVNDQVTFPDVPPGDHDVTLEGVAANCTVAGDNPRTVNVPAGGTGSTTFSVTCTAIEPPPPGTGTLEVNTSTTGEDLDPDGYTVAVPGQTSQAIGVNDQVTFPDVPAGDHEVTLEDLAANCTVTGDNPRTVNVPDGGVGATTFDVVCTAIDPGGAAEVIVWFTNRDGDNEIYKMNPDGTAQTRLTINPASDDAPNVSMDGTKVVFVSNRDGNDEIYSMDIDGTNVVRLTTRVGRDFGPRWSFDGSQIVFVRRTGGIDDVWVMNADGTGATQLTSGAGANFDPSFSPDGTQIAFNSNRDGQNEIYIMDADGSNQVRLTNDPANDQDPVFSPDGTQLAFESDRAAVVDDVFVMNTDGTNVTQLTTNGGNDPFYSPDGTQITFERSVGGGVGDEIFTMNADGTNQVNISNAAGSDADPSWGGGL